MLAPVATIFDADGELDLAAYRENMEFYATSPLDGVVIMGSNGEYTLLSDDEKIRLIAAGVEGINRRRTVLVGTGVESTRGTIDLTKKAAELGADFALVNTPHYFRPRYDYAANLKHYLSVAEASPIPVIVYIMALYTGVDLPTNLVAELSQHPNIVGVKDSGGSAPKVAEMIAYSSSDFGVLAGSASFIYPALVLGATGGIMALANVAPREVAAIREAYVAGDHETARQRQFTMLAPNAAVTSKYGIPGLKVALEHVGLRAGLPREPLAPLNEKDAADVRRILDAAGIQRAR
ncbi:MAG: dihydrodipicolinate synthase family protein [Thermomicrobiales bacterium]|nr:dihydrodipicolinate synthase family protein [Thermomicrobiales bacterium]